MTAEKDYSSAVELVTSEIGASLEATDKLMKDHAERKTRSKRENGQSTRIEVVDGRKGDANENREPSTKATTPKKSKAPQKAPGLKKDPWVGASFRVRASKEQELHTLYHQLQLKGHFDVTKQQLVDEALDWLVKKYN